MTDTESPQLVACNNPDCTVAETGLCLRSIDRYQEVCPDFKGSAIDSANQTASPSTEIEKDTVPFDLAEPSPRRFWSGQELGIKDAESIMRSTYTHLIGIVGLTNSGKTCFLSSLYLRLCSGKYPLQKYLFSGSRSLVGFEERSVGLRWWEDGEMPDQLSEHTVMSDPRSPGFMHIRIAEATQFCPKFELLLSDLPGEWFRELYLNSATADRLDFLRRADVILLFLDSAELLDPERRHNHIHANRLIVTRIAETIDVDRRIPVGIIISKIDLLKEQELDIDDFEGIDVINQEVTNQGYTPRVMPIASFSCCPELISNGHGVEEVIDFCLSRRIEPPKFDLVPSKKYPAFRSFHMIQSSPEQKLT